VDMVNIDLQEIDSYLSKLYSRKIEEIEITQLKKEGEDKSLKEYGYGTPLRIDFKLDGGARSLVLSTVKPGGFGHERISDRAAITLLQHESFNALPRHVPAIDVGLFNKDGSLKTLKDYEEFFLITPMISGSEYYRDLERIKETGRVTDLDIVRCHNLAEYLSETHDVKKNEPELYRRRIRELIGHNECILGITDSYVESNEFIDDIKLVDLEKRCIEWRWKLKRYSNRLCQVHGDYHPWNIMFRKGVNFTLLDRSRGSWGEPADDVAAITINYLFYSLLSSGNLSEPFSILWNRFYKTYLEMTGDRELLEVIQPFITWRALVIASPVWYPNLAINVRKSLLSLAQKILEINYFNPLDNSKINSLLRDNN
jgi:hypothetical protein